MVFDQVVEMRIDFQFLRAVVKNVDGAGVHLRLQIEADGSGISNDLRRMLIERHQQAAFCLPEGAFTVEVGSEDGFAGPEMPTTMVVEPS